MTTSPIFLTGASGHLGVAIARALLARPEAPPVRLLVRSPKKIHKLIAADDSLKVLDRAEIVVGDFRDRSVLERGLDGAKVAIHNLHSHEYWRGTEHIVDVNVGGARQLAEEAVRAEIDQLIYIGSYSVHGRTGGPTPDDLLSMSARGASSQAKYVVQEILTSAAEGGERFRLDVVSPSYMMGPWQLDPTYFGILFHLVRMCRLKWALPGGVNLVDVRDVARAVVGCLEAESPSRVLATGDNLSFRQMFRTMNRLAGRPYEPRLIPARLLRAVPRLRYFGEFGRNYFDRPHFVDQPSDIDRRFEVEQTIADTIDFAGRNLMFDNRWQLLRWVSKRYL